MPDKIMNKSTKNAFIFLHLTVLFYLLIRFFLVGKIIYWFIPWNILLGWLPIVCMYFYRPKNSKLLNYLLVFLWFILLPNALYVITDLAHPIVVHRLGAVATEGQYWSWLKFVEQPLVQLDIMTLFISGVIGVILYFIGVKLAKQKLYPTKLHWHIVSIVMPLLTSIAIYLGRSLRWNSWDIFVHPIQLIADVFKILFNPDTLIDLTLYIIIFTPLAWLCFYLADNQRSSKKQMSKIK